MFQQKFLKPRYNELNRPVCEKFQYHAKAVYFRQNANIDKVEILRYMITLHC